MMFDAKTANILNTFIKNIIFFENKCYASILGVFVLNYTFLNKTRFALLLFLKQKAYFNKSSAEMFLIMQSIRKRSFDAEPDSPFDRSIQDFSHSSFGLMKINKPPVFTHSLVRSYIGKKC